jgi:hypothetical protein
MLISANVVLAAERPTVACEAKEQILAKLKDRWANLASVMTKLKSDFYSIAGADEIRELVSACSDLKTATFEFNEYVDEHHTIYGKAVRDLQDARTTKSKAISNVLVKIYEAHKTQMEALSAKYKVGGQYVMLDIGSSHGLDVRDRLDPSLDPSEEDLFMERSFSFCSPESSSNPSNEIRVPPRIIFGLTDDQFAELHLPQTCWSENAKSLVDDASGTRDFVLKHSGMLSVQAASAAAPPPKPTTPNAKNY